MGRCWLSTEPESFRNKNHTEWTEADATAAEKWIVQQFEANNGFFQDRPEAVGAEEGEAADEPADEEEEEEEDDEVMVIEGWKGPGDDAANEDPEFDDHLEHTCRLDEEDEEVFDMLQLLAARAQQARAATPVPDLAALGYDPHKPPETATWDLDCPSWRVADRMNSDLTQPLGQDFHDWGAITAEDSFTNVKELEVSRLHERTKIEMYKLHLSDPAKWDAHALATHYGMGQPRVQAILRLLAWEDEERRVGLLLPEEDEFEDLVEEWTVLLHEEFLQELEEAFDVELPRGNFRQDFTLPRGGPLGKYRKVRDDEYMPRLPDPLGKVKIAEAKHKKRLEDAARKEAAAIRVQKSRWNFVIKNCKEP